MPHLIFNSAYDYYDLSEENRIKLIGRVFKERQYKYKYGKILYTNVRKDVLYIPIGLHKEEFNYGIQQGVLYISPILKTDKDDKWFRVAAFSPDDLDIDLDFEKAHVCLRQDVIEFIKGPMHKYNRKYREVLEQIKNKFKAGKLI